MNVVEQAFQEIGLSQVEIAKRFKISKQAVNAWLQKGIPDKHVVGVEELLRKRKSQLTRTELCEDWQCYWPDFKKKPN